MRKRPIPTATIKGYPTSLEFMLDLANGRLDAVSDDISVLEEWLNTPDGACCKIVGTHRSQFRRSMGEGAGIAVRKGETDLVNKFNAAIDAIRANGKYKEINDKYFTFDVYGAILTGAVRGGRRRLAAARRSSSGEAETRPMQSSWTLLSWGPEGWLDDIFHGVFITVALAAATLPAWPSYRLLHRPGQAVAANPRCGSPATSTRRSFAACRNF